jgi:hypothetical protein
MNTACRILSCGARLSPLDSNELISKKMLSTATGSVLQTDNGLLTLEPRTALGVVRSFGAAPALPFSFTSPFLLSVLEEAF